MNILIMKNRLIVLCQFIVVRHIIHSQPMVSQEIG